MKRFVLVTCVALFGILAAFAPPAFAREKCTIAWSIYVGWMPIQYMKDSGILKKWADKYGVDLDITPPMDYVESINQYTAGSFCGLAVTNMDVLTGPAIGRFRSTFIVAGDFSYGNDGAVGKSSKPLTIADVKGKTITLVKDSVSHFLLWQWLVMNGMSLADVTLVNASSETDVLNAFLSGSDGTYIVTWNPLLMQARNEKGAQLLFDSSKIPGEIIDGIVVNNGASEAVKKAIVGAWYETVGILKDPSNPARAKAVAAMANFSGTSVGEFEAQLKTTNLFFTPESAAAFAGKPDLKKTMDLVRRFVFEIGLYGNAASPDVVGIKFPDGSVLGDAGNVQLIFDSTYMELAAKGAL